MEQKKEIPQPLMVTIRCCTFNQEPYIRDCLEGFVMQKTNFRFEAIVHDDASTDGTAAIIKEYAEKYPDIIKPILETENQYSKHDGSLGRIMNEHTHGKYVAYCEGDDYWIDPLKLQKQVDFLESHPDISFSCCRFQLLNQQNHTIKLFENKYFDNEENADKTEFIFDTKYAFLESWVAQTMAIVIRRTAMTDERNKFKYNRDVHMFYYALKQNPAVCQNFVGGVYRINPTSTFAGLSEKTQMNVTFRVYEEFYEYERNPILRKCLFKALRTLMFHGSFPKPRYGYELVLYPQVFLNYSISKLRIHLGRLKRLFKY